MTDAQSTWNHAHTTPRLRVRPGVWGRVTREMGWRSVRAAALDLGVANTTLARAVEDSSVPGERLIAAILHNLPRHWRFEDLFEVVIDEVQP